MVFKSFIKKEKNAIYIGAPEAEAESLPTSKVHLRDVYEDLHNLYEELSDEKFILIGRKGCGKSAFAEYTYLSAIEKPNLFCSFVSQDNLSLETLVQLGSENNSEHTKDHLFKWLIYTNIIKMFFENEAAAQANGYKLLQEFLKKNSGYIDINTGEIVELIKKHSFEVSIEQFKRFFKGRFNTDIQIKESRAAFYKLIPHLEKVVVEVLTSELNTANENSYALFFDDLDIDFDANDDSSTDTLIQLIRTCKHVNNTVFAKNNALAKVIILIRDDVERLLSMQAADISKVFSSYSTRLSWSDDDYSGKSDENGLAIKKMINKRISNAFHQAGLQIKNQDTPWESLIDDDFSPKTSFKYVCDHTLIRPRDLILFFKPLESGYYSIPLSKSDVNQLLGRYSAELVKELSNELSSFYTPIQIQNIFDALKDISSKYDCTYSEAVEFIEKNCSNLPSEKLLQELYDRSIIGGISGANGYAHFKHRTSKKDAHEYKIDPTAKIIVHSGVNINLRNR
ncbi:P-loop ATPase, Sll1717 family [Pectobacterium carotovorum]|uniref:P-loop ATPase, Sll1717 family n=1 Tax=Pectobacterium carotovorum TaxID=554 RepID=UPI00193D89D3|nr:hypothetical protein [Pectobacterium carotovorum]QRN39741.1 hypothetical protein IHJ55_07715 [Pectobacterium carotovorum]ULS51850.1 hypothetical protein GBN63_19680 [Pectobacterium carotovorum]